MKNVKRFRRYRDIYICMIYLIEPYNAYQQPARKKHWTEIAEEEALYMRMIQEAQAKQQQQQTSVNNQNVALPQYFPQPAQQQVQDGQYAAPAGGGGWVPSAAEEVDEPGSFAAIPTSGVGPLTVTFVNYTPTPDNDKFYWSFGSGSLTSSLASPAPLVYVNTGSYTVLFQSTSSAGFTTVLTTTITVAAPTLAAGFTVALSTGSAPSIETFTNATTYNGNGTLTYKWLYGTGSFTSSLQNPPSLAYSSSGPFTASLQVTESSFKLTSVYTQSWRLI